MKLRTKILSAGKTAAGIEVPLALVESLGPSKRPKVRVTVGGHTYRSSIASMGGKFMLGVSNEVRQQAGIAAGETHEFEIVLDAEVREVTVPPDLAKALAADAKAQKFFSEGTSYSNKRWYTLWIEAAKKPETRAARVAKAITMLRAGKKQG